MKSSFENEFITARPAALPKPPPFQKAKRLPAKRLKE